MSISQGKTNSPRAKGSRALAARLPSSGSTKKGAWGRGTARAQTDEGGAEVRVVAVPEGGAAVEGVEVPRTAAQQLPAPLNALTAQKLSILLPPRLAILRTALGHGIGMPAVFAPLEQLAMQLRQAPLVHQAAGAVQPGPFGLPSPAAPAKGIGRGVVPRPAAIERVAEMERRRRPRPAGTLPLVLARQHQLGATPLPPSSGHCCCSQRFSRDSHSRPWCQLTLSTASSPGWP